MDPHATSTADSIALAEKHGAHNYQPLGVVIARARGEWVWDPEGRKYLDLLSAYGAVNQGHCHPRIVKALVEQSWRATLTSRAFHNDQLGPWLADVCALTGKEKVLPMNTGAEAVETAIKLARKWGYQRKGVPHDAAEIVVCDGNFHGRTTTLVGFSSDAQYRDGFGPFTPGFKRVPFGDAAALAAAITPNTVAFLVEPIQAEAGVIVPPDGYLARAATICREARVLLMVDEIQTGLGRTGRMFAFEHEGVRPDVIVMGKALGGGVLPISAVAADDDVMSVFTPGDHGSTFGGNPLACAVSRAALAVLTDEKLAERAERLGAHFRDSMRGLPATVVKEIRGKGLLNAIEIHPAAGDGARHAAVLKDRGLLVKETHGTVLRVAPPLTIADDALEQAIATLRDVFSRPLARE